MLKVVDSKLFVEVCRGLFAPNNLSHFFLKHLNIIYLLLIIFLFLFQHVYSLFLF